jgi:hypothetical protein
VAPCRLWEDLFTSSIVPAVAAPEALLLHDQ